MSKFYKAYGYDKEIAVEGNWFDINGIPTKLAYMHHTEIGAKVEAARNKLKEEVKRELTQKEHEKIGEDAFVNDVLLDWDVEDYPCTPEHIKETIREFPEYLNDCMTVADNNRKFQEKYIKESVEK